MTRFPSLTALAAALALFLAACGGGESGDPVATETATGGEGGGSVASLDDVQSATIQIVAEGSFVDPEVGEQLNTAGAGSGFIIDPSGIAVTNNHVVTGSALLRVFVGGEDEPRNARILGVSECSDLAVIDIEGEGYPTLGWYEGDIKTGLEVYAAGFPLGDPEFTLTRGIISKASANGETEWASVDDVVEHDATINPGNSGGPLVTAEGRLVGVNYAGSSSTNQYFAIARSEAQAIIDDLRAERDVTSIGVNGTAVSDGEGLSGIWVASVASGSPADSAGVRGGDIITRLEGLVLSTDGTMADYCDILRSRSADDTMSLEVLRFATSEVLEGQLNGRELSQSFSFGTALADQAGAATTDDGETGVEGGQYREFTTVSDDTGAIQVEVPARWTDVDGDALEGVIPAVAASPDLAALEGGWDTPGVVVAATSELPGGDSDTLLDEFSQEESCTSTGREDYDDGAYKGRYELWSECDGTETSILTIVAEPEDQSFVVFVLIQIVSDADLDATDRIIESFSVVGEV